MPFRADLNISTSSLPSEHFPGSYNHGTGPSRAFTPNSMASWTRPPCRYQKDSTEQSMRSASLTSIVDMYRRPSRTSRTGSTGHSAGSFYYDYSEEFEAAAQRETDPVFIHLSPIPSKLAISSQPKILMNPRDSTLPQPTALMENCSPHAKSFEGMGYLDANSRCVEKLTTHRHTISSY